MTDDLGALLRDLYPDAEAHTVPDPTPTRCRPPLRRVRRVRGTSAPSSIRPTATQGA